MGTKGFREISQHQRRPRGNLNATACSTTLYPDDKVGCPDVHFPFLHVQTYHHEFGSYAGSLTDMALHVSSVQIRASASEMAAGWQPVGTCSIEYSLPLMLHAVTNKLRVTMMSRR